MKGVLRETLITIILAVIIFFIVNATIQVTVVRYTCMEPGIQEGQWLIVDKITYRFHEPERGDIIVFDPPFESTEPFIKRIIGLPGESIEIIEGSVYIYKDGNTLLLDEPYIKELPTYTFNKYSIPENEYFVLGDNRNNSSDSHNRWTVREEDIMGKAWLSIWPPGQWRFISNPL